MRNRSLCLASCCVCRQRRLHESESFTQALQTRVWNKWCEKQAHLYLTTPPDSQQMWSKLSYSPARWCEWLQSLGSNHSGKWLLTDSRLCVCLPLGEGYRLHLNSSMHVHSSRGYTCLELKHVETNNVFHIIILTTGPFLVQQRGSRDPRQVEPWGITGDGWGCHSTTTTVCHPTYHQSNLCLRAPQGISHTYTVSTHLVNLPLTSRGQRGQRSLEHWWLQCVGVDHRAQGHLSRDTVTWQWIMAAVCHQRVFWGSQRFVGFFFRLY